MWQIDRNNDSFFFQHNFRPKDNDGQNFLKTKKQQLEKLQTGLLLLPPRWSKSWNAYHVCVCEVWSLNPRHTESDTVL